MSIELIAPETMRYKMIFSDIDGTLINSKGQVSAATKQKIQELCRGGVPFILVSARMPSGVLVIQKELGVKTPIICYGGALVLDEHGACIKSVGISREKAIIIDEFIKNEWREVCCGAFSHNIWLVDDISNEWVVEEQKITSSLPTAGKICNAIPVDAQVHKFLCMGEPEQIAGLSKAVKEKYPELAVHRSKDTYLEIMSGSASKASALEHLCSSRNVPVEETVSFGDNFNDVDMLLATGTSFAMGNAPEEVKRQAKFVTLDNDHEGVLVGLEKLNFA